MNVFHFNKNGEPQPNESGRSGDTTKTIQVANICSVVLDESPSTTQQVPALFKAMSHHSFIEHVKSADFIVQTKEIKVSVFNQTNTKSIIK